MKDTTQRPESAAIAAAGARQPQSRLRLSWLGFQNAYNIPLFVIFAGAMLAFSVARLGYIDPRIFSKYAAPGEWYWYQNGYYRIALVAHLATILPAGILMIFQFVPVIRHRAMWFHRINGHVVMVLILVGNVCGLMIARRAFGGEIAGQAAVGVIAISTTVGLSMAYYNIKKLQVDQHRAWMLRTMFYLGGIITTRVIMIVAALVISAIGSYSVIMTCGELGSMNGAAYLAVTYPNCVANSTILVDEVEIIRANLIDGVVEEVAASLRINFAMSLWISIFLHYFGIEIYLALTPREAERLRVVAYEKQLKAGMKNPGSAGLVIEKFGDADEWKPAQRWHRSSTEILATE